MQVTSLPAKFLLSSSWGVSVQPYPNPSSPQGHRGSQPNGLSPSSCSLPSPRNAWRGLALSGEDVWDRLKCLLPSLPPDQPSPAHALEFGSFTLFSGRTLRSLPLFPPSLPLTGVHGATNKETTPNSPLSALSKRSRALGQGQGEAREGEPGEWMSIAQVEADLASWAPAAL